MADITDAAALRAQILDHARVICPVESNEHGAPKIVIAFANSTQAPMFEAELMSGDGQLVVCGAPGRSRMVALLSLLNATANVITVLRGQGKLPSWALIESVETLKCGGKYNAAFKA